VTEIVYEKGDLLHPGDLLREEVRQRGLRQVDIARDLGISEKHLSQVLNARVLPSVEHVIALSDYLEISPRLVWNVQSRYILDTALGERAVRE
jgi:HTH-type transcriptional regulator/antitoxin HigA